MERILDLVTMLIFSQCLQSAFKFRDSQHRPRERGEIHASLQFSVSMSLRRRTRQAPRISCSVFTLVAAGMRERLQYNHMHQSGCHSHLRLLTPGRPLTSAKELGRIGSRFKAISECNASSSRLAIPRTSFSCLGQCRSAQEIDGSQRISRYCTRSLDVPAISEATVAIDLLRCLESVFAQGEVRKMSFSNDSICSKQVFSTSFSN